MDLHYMITKMWPGIQLVFAIGYLPQEEDFQELSPDLYDAFKLKVSEEDLKAMHGKKIMALLPDNPEVCNRLRELYGNNFVILSEEEMGVFEDIRAYFDRESLKAGKDFKNMHDKLAYMAGVLPSAFTDDTSYAVYQKPIQGWQP